MLAYAASSSSLLTRARSTIWRATQRSCPSCIASYRDLILPAFCCRPELCNLQKGLHLGSHLQQDIRIDHGFLSKRLFANGSPEIHFGRRIEQGRSYQQRSIALPPALYPKSIQKAWHCSSHEFIKKRYCECHIAMRRTVDHSFFD